MGNIGAAGAFFLIVELILVIVFFMAIFQIRNAVQQTARRLDDLYELISERWKQ